MCGISGILATTITAAHQALLADTLTAQQSRGPDHRSQIHIKSTKQQVLLGHNRLSIIDLTDEANQPMWDERKQLCIVYNGEIYNYHELRAELMSLGARFRTQSDTEVILQAFSQWGIDCLSRFRGPFAFALYDTKANTLLLARDRFGVRPLYFTHKHNELYFASTTRTLAKALHLQPNLEYLATGLHYLVYENASDATAYQHLFSLSPGMYLQAHINTHGMLQYALHRYYDLASEVEKQSVVLAMQSPTILLQTLQQTLHDAVSMRLRADVPLGISLSGGLDSSSVAAWVKHLHPQTLGFSFSHPEQSHSEGREVAHCAKQLHLDMHYVWPDANDMMAGYFHTLAAQELPFPSISVVAQNMLYQRVRATGVKVLLGGQGGDEAFMGYKKFLVFALQQHLRQKQYGQVSKHLFSLLPTLMAELTRLPFYWQQRLRYRQQSHNRTLLCLPAPTPLQLGFKQNHLWERQLLDVTQFSLPTLLRYEDRNAMAHGVESRLPFLDHHVMELGLALPTSLKLRGGYGKWAIRELTKNIIPNQIRLARYKRGFDVSLAPLVQAGFGKMLRDALLERTDILQEFLREPTSFQHDFSDHALLSRKNAFAEATTLLWLSKVST